MKVDGRSTGSTEHSGLWCYFSCLGAKVERKTFCFEIFRTVIEILNVILYSYLSSLFLLLAAR